MTLQIARSASTLRRPAQGTALGFLATAVVAVLSQLRRLRSETSGAEDGRPVGPACGLHPSVDAVTSLSIRAGMRAGNW